METNLYEPLAVLIETQKFEVAHRTAEAAIASQSPLFNEMSATQIAERLVVSVDMVIRYLRSGDASEWTAFISRTSAAWREKGYTADQVNAVGKTIAAKMVEVVEERFPGPEQQVERERYIRRINGLDSLAGISSLVAHLKEEEKNK